jgi:hypothetical protein
MRGSRSPSVKRTPTAISQPANQIVLTRRDGPWPPSAARAPDAQEETGQNDREEEPDVGEEQGAGRERREVRDQRELSDDRVEGVGEQWPRVSIIQSRMPMPMATTGRHDLIRGEPGHEKPDGGEGGGQEQEAEEATVDRTPVGVAVDAEDGGVAAVSASISTGSERPAANLARMISISLTGDVRSSSSVPALRSSATSRIVTTGTIRRKSTAAWKKTRTSSPVRLRRGPP